MTAPAIDMSIETMATIIATVFAGVALGISKASQIIANRSKIVAKTVQDSLDVVTEDRTAQAEVVARLAQELAHLTTQVATLEENLAQKNQVVAEMAAEIKHLRGQIEALQQRESILEKENSRLLALLEKADGGGS